MTDSDIDAIARTAVQSLPPHIHEVAGDIFRCTLRTVGKHYDAELDQLRQENTQLVAERDKLHQLLAQLEDADQSAEEWANRYVVLHATCEGLKLERDELQRLLESYTQRADY